MQYSLLFLSFLSVSHSLPLVSREALHDLAPRLVPRDAPQLLSQIRDLNTAVTSLTSAVNAFDGSLLGLLPQSLAVVATEAKVDALTLKATYTAEQSSNFTAAESTEIVQTLATQIGPIQDSLNAIKAKYPEFKKTLESPIVLFDLKVLKKHTDGLIEAVKEKVTPDNAGLLEFGAGILDQAFNDAIAVYS